MKIDYCHIRDFTASLQIYQSTKPMWKINGKRVTENICTFGRGKDNYG